ncbi:TPA: MASE1 domain-containing protein [Burkholderia vietnamiensis]|nr:MASE1 domain-containing protein [Burkholderia vietnamiensis]
MGNWRLRLASIIGTVVVFVLSLWINQEVFTNSEFVRGVNWIYLPSGVRLLATLLLGADGAIGLLAASWLVDFLYFFPGDPMRSIAGGIIATVVPYAVYRIAREQYGLHASLANLTPKLLLVLALAFSVANPLLANIWLALNDNTTNIGERFFAMFVGDLSGALIVLYAMKALISVLPTRRPTGLR